jgi:hypothetical protein
MDQAHAKSADEVIRFYGVDSENGLSDQQVKDAQARYGLNGELNHPGLRRYVI